MRRGRRAAAVALAAALALSGCGSVGCPGDGSVLDLFLRFLRMCHGLPEAKFAVADLDAYRRFHEEALPATHDGRELAALLQQYRDEAASLTRVDEPLWAMGYTTLDRWHAATHALLDGAGAKTVVTQPMVDSLDLYLARLAGTGSPELAGAIASERKVRPPLQTLVGLDMEAANALLFPPQRVFRDDFE